MTFLNGVTAYDGLMALIVFFITVHGYWKGAAWQFAPIMSLVFGYMIAMPMSVTMAHYFGEPPQNRLYALVSIYIGVALIVYLLVRSFRAGLEKAKLTEFDRHIGALLGFLKGVLLTLSATVVLLIYSPPAREQILKSETRTIAAKIINAVYPILPQAMHQILRPYLKQVEGELPLDLPDFDASLNADTLPEHGATLRPTSSSARRVYENATGANSRVGSQSFVDEEEVDLPAPRPPKRTPAQYYDDDSNRSPRDDRDYDSVTRANNRRSTSVRESELPTRRSVLVPTPEEDEDPFLPSSTSRDLGQPRR